MRDISGDAEAVRSVYPAPSGAGLDRVSAMARLHDAATRLRQAEVDQVVLIAEAADLWSWVDNPLEGETGPDPALVGERLWRFGGDGTPLASEFLTHEVGPALGVSPDAAGGLIAEVLDLRHRLPLLWRLVTAGQLRVPVARQVARLTHSLSWEHARVADARLALHAVGWTRHKILATTRALVLELEPDRADVDRAAGLASRRVGFGRMEDSGVVALWSRLDAVAAGELDATLSKIAHRLSAGGDPREWSELRAVGLEMLADPAVVAGLLGDSPEGPTAPGGREVQIVLHLGAEALEARSGAEWAGIGPVGRRHLADLVAGASRVTVLPVLDPTVAGHSPRYQIPESMRRRVMLRNPTVVFPYSTRRSAGRGVDLDHTIEWPRGATTDDNLGPLDRKTHRAKTWAGFRLRQVRPGVFRWHTPARQAFWVTPHGTFTSDPDDGVLADVRAAARAVLSPTPASHARATAGVDSCPF